MTGSLLFLQDVGMLEIPAELSARIHASAGEFYKLDDNEVILKVCQQTNLIGPSSEPVTRVSRVTGGLLEGY